MMKIYLNPGGRLGNALFRYFGAVYLIIKNQYNHVICYEKNKKMDVITDKIFDDMISSNNSCQHKYKDIILKGYFQYDIYKKYKSEIVSYMKKNLNDVVYTDGNDLNTKHFNYNSQSYKISEIINDPLNFTKFYKVVIHVRLEDFVKYNFYIKTNSLINVLNTINLIDSCIVVNKPTTEFEHNYIKTLVDFYTKKYKKTIKIESNSVIEDFHIMKNAEILICSLSTLSWFASLLSDKLHTCYMPDWKHSTPGLGDHTRFRKPIDNTIFYPI